MHLHRGAEVAQLSFQNAWDIEDVRLQLEARACLSAGPFHDQSSCGRLRSVLADMDTAQDQPTPLARLNRNFHTELMAFAPNAFLREHVQELWDRVWQLSSASFFEFMPRRMGRLAAEGRTIVDHIESQDWRGLEAFLKTRIEDVTAAWQEAAVAYEKRALAETPHS
jgi:DNA-binding GntR family transcriptional regulator